MKKTITLIIICFALQGCKIEDEKLIPGVWIINSMSYENKDVMPYLIVNVITIRADKTCDLPIGDINYRHTDKEKGTWKIYKKKGISYFKITSSNELFAGDYKIEKILKERDNKTGGNFVKMEITTSKIKLIAVKDFADKGL